jgi:hypothetical protein
VKEFAESKANAEKDAIAKLEKILVEANMRILRNGLNPLLTALRGMVNESNKSLVRLALNFNLKLIEALGFGAKKFTKLNLRGIFSNLSDKQSVVQDAMKVLLKWAELNGVEAITRIRILT